MKNIPERLKKGDCIGIICPSSGINSACIHRINNAKKYIQSLGYRVKMGQYIVSGNEGVAGTISERANDLNSMFADREVKMIVPAIGGLLANQLLNFIDYDLVKKNPKIFFGYSDITVLHYALYSQGNLLTYYAPCVATQFAEYPKMHEYTLNSMMYAISEEYSNNVTYKIESSKEWTQEFLSWGEKKDLERARKMIPNKGMWWLREGVCNANVIPSCVVSINHLAGTKYWIDLKDKILVLDLLLCEGEINYPILDASITDLYNLEVFDNIAGLVLSRPCGFTDDEEKRLYNRILDLTAGKNYPILCNFDIGHTDPINTIRYDSVMELDSSRNMVQITN